MFFFPQFFCYLFVFPSVCLFFFFSSYIPTGRRYWRHGVNTYGFERTSLLVGTLSRDTDSCDEDEVRRLGIERHMIPGLWDPLGMKTMYDMTSHCRLLLLMML